RDGMAAVPAWHRAWWHGGGAIVPSKRGMATVPGVKPDVVAGRPGMDLPNQALHPLQAYLTQQPLDPPLGQPGPHLPTSAGMSTVDASSPLLRAIQAGGVVGTKAPSSYNEDSNMPPGAPRRFFVSGDDLARADNPVSERLLEVTGSSEAGTSRVLSSSSTVPPPGPLPPGEVVNTAALLATPWQQLTVAELRLLLEQGTGEIHEGTGVGGAGGHAGAPGGRAQAPGGSRRAPSHAGGHQGAMGAREVTPRAPGGVRAMREAVLPGEGEGDGSCLVCVQVKLG
ncbi:hypothetical protein CYMTET_19224, partial [Cymbomonas tetramitiformis]